MLSRDNLLTFCAPARCSWIRIRASASRSCAAISSFGRPANLERLRRGQTPKERSGVVWHTQGSGKSLTMVFVARMLRASQDLNDFKIFWSTTASTWKSSWANGHSHRRQGEYHRKHPALRRQLAHRQFRHQYGDGAQVQGTGRELDAHVAEALGTLWRHALRKTFGVVNQSERIILMIDEAHRTQGSDLGGQFVRSLSQCRAHRLYRHAADHRASRRKAP